jgi:hypothetical protein
MYSQNTAIKYRFAAACVSMSLVIIQETFWKSASFYFVGYEASLLWDMMACSLVTETWDEPDGSSEILLNFH